MKGTLNHANQIQNCKASWHEKLPSEKWFRSVFFLVNLQQYVFTANKLLIIIDAKWMEDARQCAAPKIEK